MSDTLRARRDEVVWGILSINEILEIENSEAYKKWKEEICALYKMCFPKVEVYGEYIVNPRNPERGIDLRLMYKDYFKDLFRY